MPTIEDDAKEFMKELEKITKKIEYENDKRIDALQGILDPAERMGGENQKVMMEKLKLIGQQIRLITEQTAQTNKIVQAVVGSLK